MRKRHLASVIGYLQSTCLALPSGRFHLVHLYSDLNSKPGWRSSTVVTLCQRSLNELQHFWRDPPTSAEGRSWFPPTKTALLHALLITDASKYAWGAHAHISDLAMIYDGPGPLAEARDPLGPGPSDRKRKRVILTRGTFNQTQSELGSTLREFDAVLNALANIGTHLS